MTALDRWTEHGGRWVAARQSRRSFLGRVGRLAVLVASGPTLATFLSGRAEARVCGQSGVSPKCPTYDCVGADDVWGWCWYASPGCCSGGGLKKICDCCRLNHNNVHGYCPSGYNVYCIVESCYADPRVMSVPLTRIRGERAAAVAARVATVRYPAGAATAVLADGDHELLAAVAGPWAAATKRPLVLTAPGSLSSGAIAALQRLKATQVWLASPTLPDSISTELGRYGITVAGRLGTATETGPWSLEVADAVAAITGARRQMCVAPSGVSASAAPLAGAAGAAMGYPLVIGTAGAAERASSDGVVVTYLVGAEAAADAGKVPGGHPLHEADLPNLARHLGAVVTEAEHKVGISVGLAPDGHASVMRGLVDAGGVVLVHPSGTLDETNAEWIRGHQPHVARGIAAGLLGELDDASVWRLQSELNHFDNHRLMGVSGQGLPVISQPQSEREIGDARVAGTAEPDGSGYWVSRANPSRR